MTAKQTVLSQIDTCANQVINYFQKHAAKWDTHSSLEKRDPRFARLCKLFMDLEIELELLEEGIVDQKTLFTF